MQQGSRWIFQATRTDGDLGWYKIKPDQMIGLNPIFAIILMPFCNYLFFPLMEKFGLGSLLHRITVGGFLCCIAFVIAIFVELKIQSGFISIFWLFPQFAVLALSENFLFTSLLNFAYAEAPSSMKSVMTACVFVTIALGNLIIVISSGFKMFESQVYEFMFFVIILVIDLIGFIFLAIKFEK
jgi:dipeptide/tripeptide permease